MGNFQKEYNEKLTNIDGVLSSIKSEDVLITCGNACSPNKLYNNLHKIKGKVKGVKLIPIAGIEGDFPFGKDPEMKEALSIYSGFFVEQEVRAYDMGNVSYIPVNLSDGQKKIEESYGVDKYFVTVSPMDRNGYFRYSLENISTMDWIIATKKRGGQVIVEVNPNMPQIHGETEVHISMIDQIVEYDAPIPNFPDIEISETEMAIGKYVASLVEDGSTIQLGIGGIPNAVAKSLADKKDLGVHTEMITNAMADLAMKGIINGRSKTIDRGKLVGCFAFGNQELYDFLDDNPSVMIKRGSYTNSQAVIAQNDKMVSINAAIQVDLTGQVNSESLGSRQYSGTGGAADFATGATHSKGGKSIVALRSTARGGTISSIQPILMPGSTVSIRRNNLDYVVTEYGIAKLRGLSIFDRVENLINICHPDFREELRQEAKNLKLIF